MQEMQETWVGSLGREDPLEKGTATHFQCSCLETPMSRRAWHAAVHGSQRVGHDQATNTFTFKEFSVQAPKAVSMSFYILHLCRSDLLMICRWGDIQDCLSGPDGITVVLKMGGAVMLEVRSG